MVLANATPNGVLYVLHVLTAIYFALGVVLGTIFTLQVPNTPTLSAKARVMGNSSRVALLMIIPGALLAGILGLVLAFQEFSKPFNHGWIVASLVLFIAAVVVGGAAGPISARTRRMVEAEARAPRPSAALVAALRSPLPLIFTALNLLIAIALVVLMFVQKPQ
ncbi:MAG: DUF2269 family protein [Ktedonobacterales bacterium]|nr:DUF2269 family protein [Ktedonobacterales bacterium]